MKPKLSRLAIVSFLLGIVALVLATTGQTGPSVLAFPTGFLALSLGGLAAGLIRWGQPPSRGLGRALTGAALGILAIFLAILGLVRNFNRQFEPQDWQRGRNAGFPQPPANTGGPRPPLTNFASRLPVVILNTGGRSVWKEELTVARAEFYEAGRTAVLDPARADHSGLVTLRLRGNSSLRLPKSSFTLHTVDATTNQVKVALLGLPKEEDWVLYAPFEDKTLIRDVLAFELARKMGRYAPRTRFVELFVNRSSGPASTRDYEGLYVLIEKIKRGSERVSIAKLEPGDASEPAISGGYIVKRDHRDRDGRRFHTGYGGPYFYVYPNDRSITAEQRSWLSRYFTAFETALHGPDFSNPATGYAAYLDVASFIDAHWLIEASKNVDGFRYSAFLTKDRSGKLRTEPPWDWNRSFGNANYYGGWQTEGWYWSRLRDNEISWHLRLRQDPAYVAQLTARWRELRKTVFDPTAIQARIDQLAAELEGAQQRNFKRWPILGRQITCNYYVGGSYEDEIRWLQTWIERRVAWIDHQVGPEAARPP